MILVVGGAGYIGSHAVKLLLDQGKKVAVIDNLFRGYKQAIDTLQQKYGKDKLEFYQADLRDEKEIDRLMKELKPEGVMHFAALCLVNESMEKPEDYFENNVVGSFNLLRAMVNNGVKNLVFSSTCAVYGESQYLPVDEKHPLSPSNPYGESKLMVEQMIKWFGRIYNFPYVIFRYFNVAGASSEGIIGDSKKPSQLLTQNAVRGALGMEEFKLTCPKVDTTDGTPVRDYINVEDLAEAHALAIEYLQKGGESDVFNLGTGKGNSVLEIVNRVKEITGAEFPIAQGEARKGEYAEIYANNKKAVEKLGWQPKRGIKESVESLVAWYKKHPNGWEY